MRRLLSVVDRAVVRATILGSRSATVAAMGAAERIERLAELEAHWHREDWLSDPEAFFGPAPEVHPATEERGSRAGRAILDLCWPSTHAPLDPEVDFAARFPHNHVVRARWMRSDRARPVILMIHGYGGGRLAREARVFPTRRWLQKGFDAAWVALPFHGARRAPGDKVRFPSSLPAVTIEGFRQAIADVRALIGHLLASGAPSVSVVGMSLGGYTSALLATVDPRPRLVLPFIPLGSLADYAARHGRFVGTPEERRAQQDRLERVYAVVSPLHRRPVLPPERLLVSSGRYDRICPPDHGRWIADNLGCEFLLFEGAHLLQAGRSRAWRAFEERLDVH